MKKPIPKNVRHYNEVAEHLHRNKTYVTPVQIAQTALGPSATDNDVARLIAAVADHYNFE